MAWTDPKNWSFKESFTSTDANTYIRDNLNALRDGTGIADGAITSRHLKPTLEVITGNTGTIVNAGQDYSFCEKTITIDTDSYVYLIFNGFCQHNTATTVTINAWNDGTKDNTDTITSQTGATGESYYFLGVARSWKYAASAGNRTYKMSARSTGSSTNHVYGTLTILVVAQ